MTKKAKIGKKWENRYLGNSWSKKARDRYKRRVDCGQSLKFIISYCNWLYYNLLVFNYNTFEYNRKKHPQGALIAARIAKKIHRENCKKNLTNPH